MRFALLTSVLLLAYPAASHALELPENVSGKLAQKIASSLANESGFADAAISATKPLYFRWATKGEYADDVATTVTSAGPGLFREEITGKTSDGAAITDVKYSTLGGLLPLVTEFGDGNGGEVLSAYEVEGNVFPLSPGNEFTVSWESVFLGTSDPFMNSEYDCTVKDVKDATQLKPSLSGKAYEVVCDIEIMGQNAGTEIYYYLIEAGYFVPDHGRGDLTTRFDVEFVAQ